MTGAVPAGSTVEGRRSKVYTSSCPDDTWAVARELAEGLPPGSVLALHGDLGSGKTCFVQGMGNALGARQTVNSPTFTLVNEYDGRLPLYHIDLYRIHSATEALNLGLDEYFEGDGITAVEWAERAAELFPVHTIHIHLEAGGGPDQRTIRVSFPRQDGSTP